MKEIVTLYLEQKWYLLDIKNIEDYTINDELKYSFPDTFITFQTEDIIREFRCKKAVIPPNIIDLESLDKQMTGLGRDGRNFENWNIMQSLHYHNILSTFQLKKNNCKEFLEYVAQLYITLKNASKEETKRFEEIEQKINCIIYKSQLKGICFSLEEAEKKCALLERNLYQLKNQLQIDYNIFSPDSSEMQENWIKTKGYRFIHSLLYTFKIHKESDIICKCIYEILRNKQDLDCLLYMMSCWGGDLRTYPSYIGFGTITSRIIMRDPCIQNMRKENRSIIIPDTDKKFLYVDYSQFEAGILASLSNDKYLIRLYNEDIYKNIAKYVYKHDNKRDKAKITFYRYMYGDDSLSKEEKNYFTQFRSLNKFISQIEKEISSQGGIGTINGNYRFKTEETYNWALSHKIQATASLIFKNALIKVYENVPKAEFLIPMHDAALYQIDNLYYDLCQKKIENIFKTEFKKICPEINPIIHVTSFCQKQEEE